MSEFGNFVPVTFVNGGVPAINDTNLNEIENLLTLTDEELRRRQTIKLSEYLEYFHSRNTKRVDFFTDASSWSADSSTTVSDDTTNNPIGNASVKMEESDNVAGLIAMEKTISKNLAEFANGETSTTSDLIMLFFYVSDSTKFTSYFEFKLGQDSSNFYYVIYNPSIFSTGWNSIYVPKSSFSSVGTPPAWSNITWIRVGIDTVINAIGEYVSFQLCYLYRQDPTYSNYYNPFQLYKGLTTGWVNKFTIIVDAIGLYRDDRIERVGLMSLDQYSSSHSHRALLVYEDTLSFVSKFEIYCKEDGKGSSITWRIDASNYIQTYISSDTLYIYEYNAASGTTVSKALSNALLKNERYLMYVEKNNDTFRTIIKKGNEAPIALEFETTLSGTGSVYIGWSGTTSFGFITDFIISQSQGNMSLQYENSSLLIAKGVDQIVNNSNVLVNDTNLWANLEENRLYHIDVFLSVLNIVSTTPDVKIAWSLTNGSFRDSRNIIAPAASTSDVGTTYVKITNAGYTTGVGYGVDGTGNESFIKESFVIETYEGGSKLQMEWSQYTAHSSDTKILGRSYMIITPVVKARQL